MENHSQDTLQLPERRNHKLEISPSYWSTDSLVHKELSFHVPVTKTFMFEFSLVCDWWKILHVLDIFTVKRAQIKDPDIRNLIIKFPSWQSLRWWMNYLGLLVIQLSAGWSVKRITCNILAGRSNLHFAGTIQRSLYLSLEEYFENVYRWKENSLQSIGDQSRENTARRWKRKSLVIAGKTWLLLALILRQTTGETLCGQEERNQPREHL